MLLFKLEEIRVGGGGVGLGSPKGGRPAAVAVLSEALIGSE